MPLATANWEEINKAPGAEAMVSMAVSKRSELMSPSLWCSLESCSREEQQRGAAGVCKRVLDKQFCFHGSLKDFPVSKAHRNAISKAQDHFSLSSDQPWHTSALAGLPALLLQGTSLNAPTGHPQIPECF